MNTKILEVEASKLGFELKFGNWWECSKCQTSVHLIFVCQHKCDNYLVKKK